MADSVAASRLAFPNAKINLGLHVIQRRPDGYHEIDSLFIPVPWCDTLEVTASAPSDSHVKLHLHGHQVAGNTKDNLVCRAHALLQKERSLPPVDFHLIKAIPSGAGLGGGSADGSFALKLLNAHFELGLSLVELEGLAAQLGSDCPFFIRNVPARVTGRGEHISPIDLDLEGWHIAMIHPGIHVPTAQAFQWVIPQSNRPGLNEWSGSSPLDWSGQLKNDFSGPVKAHHPNIQNALDHLQASGAVYAEMSGSGSTVYGFFREEVKPDLFFGCPSHWQTWSGPAVI